MRNRRDFLRTILLLCLAWVAVTILLARWTQRSQQHAGPRLLHYPGTESRPEQTLPTLNLRKYWFALPEDYPSLTVYDFYQRELTARGWRPLSPATPTWQRQLDRKDETKAHDLFDTTWISPDRLYQLRLQLLAEVTLTRDGDRITAEQRRPGLQVYVTQQRSISPWLLDPPRKERGIEVKGRK